MADKILFGLFGASGFGREVMPFAREVVEARFAEAEIVFIETSPVEKVVNGMPVISESEYLAWSGKKYFNIAIANSKTREVIATKCMANGAEALPLRASNVVAQGNIDVGEGAVLCPFSTITSNAKIGKFFHSNIYSYVAHDCVVGDYVTFAPRVSCNGNVHIGDHAYIGTGAVIKQGKPGAPLVIGEGAIVGMGAIVTKNVPPHTTVIGNPARVMEKA